MTNIILDGQSLTIEQVIAVAQGAPGAPAVILSDTARERVSRGAAAVRRLVDEGEVAYGITTGFGAFKDRLIPPDEVAALQRNLLASHAVGMGAPFDTGMTRAIMLIRANTLAMGYSGIRVETVQLLLDMLNRGVHPIIPEKGSLGASGDLAPLAHMALPMIGLGEAEYQGERLAGDEALHRAGLQPVTLVAKEGLALINGTTVMCALGALATHRAENLMHTADAVGCLTLEALHGTPLAFDERLHRLRPFPRQIACAADLRALLAGSEFTRAYDPTNVQDAYTLRCIPQVHGAARDVIAYTRWAIEIELNAVTDNPLIFVDDTTGNIDVISGGNFHGEPLALTLDYLGLAMAEMGNMSERRIMRLIDTASNGGVLPAFLIRHGGVNSGFMASQYMAAALATENKILAHPASADTIPTSANVEDHVSMGVTAGLKARQMIDNVEGILAIEWMAAAQGIDFRREQQGKNARLGRGTQPIYDLLRQHIPFLEQDAVMQPLQDATRTLIAAGEVAALVRPVVESG